MRQEYRPWHFNEGGNDALRTETRGHVRGAVAGSPARPDGAPGREHARCLGAAKLADGWTYGPTTDAAAKRHPDLVAYDQLPEDKKEYDRDAALETLKLILALGYNIVPPRNG